MAPIPLENDRCELSQLQISKPADPLAALRIDRGERRPPSGGSRWMVIALMLLTLVGVGAFAWIQYGASYFRTEVKVATVEVRVPGVADSVLAAQGYLKSRTQAAIGAKVAGRVSKIYVEEGQSVKPRDPLAELEHEDMKALLEAMDASLSAMDASLKAMNVSIVKAEAEKAESKTELDQDERDLARAELLFRGKGISAAELEKVRSKRQSSENHVRSLEAALELAEARLLEADARKNEAEARKRETQEQIQNFIVMAPPLPEGADPEKFRWTVISKEAEVGESITPGGMGAASGRGSVVTLANLLNLEVETDVKEDYVGRVREGQQVNVSVDGVKDRAFTGTVRTIIPMGDRAKGTVKVKVKLTDREVEEVNDLIAKRFRLFPEMAATAHFISEGKEAQGGKVEPQMYVPADSVKKDDSGTFVWQVTSGQVKRISIEVGDIRDGRALVQRGLRAGDQVVVDAPATLKENQPVKVQQ
jgi:multidrug efflux pump subunit AcrA (membrane-fusion protein)